MNIQSPFTHVAFSPKMLSHLPYRRSAHCISILGKLHWISQLMLLGTTSRFISHKNELWHVNQYMLGDEEEYQ